MESAGAASVFLFAQLATSFGLIYEGMNYVSLRALVGALLGLGFAAGAMISMVVFRVLIR